LKVYSLINYPYNNLLVSLYDTGNSNKANLYASFNRVPTLLNGIVVADISGCNNQFCNKVVSISTKNSLVPSLKYNLNAGNGTWYVAILSGRDNNQYSFWFDNVCPNNCSGQGSCGSTVDNYGLCTCNANYETLLCTGNNNFIEIVILIIIAALVLVSALLGLIAWAYMRRRAQYVEVR